MSDLQHTKGPWKNDGGVRVQSIGAGHDVARLELPPPHLCNFDSALAYKQAEANARLIAAAPDLLKALEWYANSNNYDFHGASRTPHVDGKPDPDAPSFDFGRIARKAISKANVGGVA